MARFVIDPGVALYLAEHEVPVRPEHELLAPTLLRSQTLAMVRERVHRGELERAAGLEVLERLWRMPIRLLGDAVLRRLAWKLADRIGSSDTYTAEYLALTQLQADAFVTLDDALAARVEGVVVVTGIDALR